jgi:hypothetical protein
LTTLPQKKKIVEKVSFLRVVFSTVKITFLCLDRYRPVPVLSRTQGAAFERTGTGRRRDGDGTKTGQRRDGQGHDTNTLASLYTKSLYPTFILYDIILQKGDRFYPNFLASRTVPYRTVPYRNRPSIVLKKSAKLPPCVLRVQRP